MDAAEMVRIEGFGRPGQFRRAVADPIEMWSSRRSQLGNQRMLLIKYETYAIGWRNQVKDRSEKEGGEGRGRVEDERVKRVGSAARLSVLLRLLVCLALRGCEVARLRGCECWIDALRFAALLCRRHAPLPYFSRSAAAALRPLKRGRAR
jgi:hypothetical protein